MSAPRETGIVVVPHTHWDREWYEPFQVFRFKLVQVLDEVLALAESDPRFRFTLDGQTAAIEDYLEIRPENTERVKEVVARGQLAIGPWQILLDEFLCSGETIVRNLQMGIAGASALGGHMSVGYLPDMFGHVAQMPQILRSAGIEHACLWRGVPAAVEGHSFSWTSPDGSAVRVEYLFDGYGSALDLFSIPERIPSALAEYRVRTASRYNGEPILGMLGTDHMPPDPRLMEYVDAYDDPAFPVRVGTLEDYLSGFEPGESARVVRGELRSHVRGNILPGVLSVRRELKIAMSRAERMVLEAERLAAIHSSSDFEPFLGMSWRRIIESTAHDSVVGSGTDETVEQVTARLHEAEQLARAVRDDVVHAIASDIPDDAYAVANTLATARTVAVELTVPVRDDTPLAAQTADGQRLPIQQIGVTPTVLGDESIDSSLLVERMLNRIHGRELFGQLIEEYEIGERSLVFVVAEVPASPVFDIASFQTELESAVNASPGDWNVRILSQPGRRVLVDVPLKPLGVTPFRVFHEAGAADDGTVGAGASCDDGVLRNGLVDARIAPDGTVTLRGADGTVLTGIGALVDGGDAGDSYNYGPPSVDTVVSEPSDVRIEVIESGPVRARARVTRTYSWPRSLDAETGGRSRQTVEVPVVMDVEVRRGEPFVRLRIRFTNQASDHRLRVHVPLPEPVTASASEGQFSITRRGLKAEGGGGEYPIPTFPAYGFVSAGPATVFLHHASEYEVVEGTELAVTVLRAVGSISVNVHPLRDEPAASQIPIPGAQELGAEVEAEFAIMASASGHRDVDAVGLADHFDADGIVTRGRSRDGSTAAGNDGLMLSGTGVRMSSLRWVGGVREVRVVLLSDEPTTATLEGPFEGVETVDLVGRSIDSVAADGTYAFSLNPWEIRTLRLTH